MIAVSLNLGGGVRLINRQNCSCARKTLQTQQGRTHGAWCVWQWFRTAEPLGERRYENWNTHCMGTCILPCLLKEGSFCDFLFASLKEAISKLGLLLKGRNWYKKHKFFPLNSDLALYVGQERGRVAAPESILIHLKGHR